MSDPGSKQFHQMIQFQRQAQSSLPDVILYQDTEIQDPPAQADALAHHYGNLATPHDRPEFDDEYLQAIERDNAWLFYVINSADFEPDITEEEVTKAISQLHSGKAPDIDSLTSEHILHAKHTLVKPLVTLFCAMQKFKHIPSVLKTGYITSLPKKGKDARLPGCHRGINITSVLSKLLESIFKERHQVIQSCLQDDMQMGFTAGLSPLMCALIITELTNESSLLKQPLYFASLDGVKAFDMVVHSVLLHSLHEENCSLEMIGMAKELYSMLMSKVTWKGYSSDTFCNLQGVRQGGVWSAGLYKTYINSLLNLMRRSGLGATIGDIYVGIPTVADDVSLLSFMTHELQAMLDLAAEFANKRRYEISADKSHVLQKKDALNTDQWYINDREITTQDSITHLGITRFANNVSDTTVEDKIALANRTLYSLMGSGVHGNNGVGAMICMQIFNVYVLPRLLYGLDVLMLSQKQIQTLTAYYNRILKQFQGLPTRTATCAVLLLVGALPFPALLHLRQFSLIGMIARSNNQTLKRLALRQAALRCSKTSWFARVNSALTQYSLPTISELLENPVPREQWKEITKQKVTELCYSELSCEAATKSSLKFLGVPDTLKTHQCWSSVEHNVKDVKRASIKARLITGTYILQSNKARFNQNKVDPTCPLCNEEDEDLQHFILRCPALEDVRKRSLPPLVELLKCHNISFEDFGIEHQLQCVIDSSKIELSIPEERIDSIPVERIECVSRRLCFDLHARRTFILDQTAKSAKRKHKLQSQYTLPSFGGSSGRL